MRKDGLAWHGGPPPPTPSEGMVTAVGVNTPREALALSDDARPGPANRGIRGPRGPSAFEDGVNVDVVRIGDDAPAARPNGRIRLPR